MMVLSSLMVNGTTMLLINNPTESIRVGGRLGLGVRGEYYSGALVIEKIESVCRIPTKFYRIMVKTRELQNDFIV
jgi:hypothetical protein